MAQYETYQSNAAEIPLMRKWLFRALILSLIIHAGLLLFFHWQKLENFGYTGEERLAPPTRVMNRVVIPEIPEETRLPLPTAKKPVAPIPIQEDKPEAQVVTIAPQITPEVAKAIVNEKPQIVPSGIDSLAKLERDSAGNMEKQLASMANAMMEKSTRSKNQPVIVVPTGPKGGEGGSANESGIPGRASVNALLERSGQLHAGDKAAIQGGALYDYNSYVLRPEAEDQLRKLGELIKRNPKATFVIEGHTDSTGTPEYNQSLSEKRAESVKLWLVQFMGIAPERIQTVGYGSAKLLVAADKSVDEQQPNRRVEIVIKSNR